MGVEWPRRLSSMILLTAAWRKFGRPKLGREMHAETESKTGDNRGKGNIPAALQDSEVDSKSAAGLKRRVKEGECSL